MKNKLRVFYALGPGNVVESYRNWKERTDVSTETSITFSSQFFDYCKEVDAEVYAISSNDAKELLQDDNFLLENRPKENPQSKGLNWHWQQWRYAQGLLKSAKAFKADVALFDSGTTHWFMLSSFAKAGIPVIASLHNALWPVGFPPQGKVQRLILWLNGRFWRNTVSASICISPTCKQQIIMCAQHPKGPIFVYKPKFREQFFTSFLLAQPLFKKPLTILFAGRIEENKGALDILKIAEKVEQGRPGQCQWHICGGGSQEDKLKHEIEARMLQKNVHYLGKQPREALLQQFNWAQLAIVPTTSTFGEGLSLVAVEAFLAYRPTLTNPVVPAIDLLDGAILNAKTDDIDSYVAAIFKILDHPQEIAQKIHFPLEIRQSFFGPRGGFADAIRAAIDATLK